MIPSKAENKPNLSPMLNEVFISFSGLEISEAVSAYGIDMIAKWIGAR